MTTPARSISHASPVTQAGFTTIPNVVMLRRDLTPSAKLVYGYLKHLAWRNDGEQVEPPLKVVAADLGMSERSLHDYVKELREAPVEEGGDGGLDRLVVSRRRGLGLPNAYVVNDPILRDGSAKSADQEPQMAQHLARARSSSLVKSKPSGAKAPVAGSGSASAGSGASGPPPVVLFDVPGKEHPQNLPLNALLEVCHVGEGSHERIARRVVPYLNGPKKGGARGIREMFWTELVAYAADRGREESLAALTPEGFEEMCARQIHAKAALFHQKMPGATMGPAALRDYWLDLPAMPRPGRGRGMTSDDVLRVLG